MKKIIKIIIAAGIVAFLLTLSIYEASGAVKNRQKEIIVEVEKKDPLTYQQRAWFGALTWCESKGNPNAVNKKDRDGTPSYGLLQFKPSTFTYFAEKYGIDGSAGYMDPKAQSLIVEQMILRNDVTWSQQFPACVKILGKPPIKK